MSDTRAPSKPTEQPRPEIRSIPRDVYKMGQTQAHISAGAVPMSKGKVAEKPTSTQLGERIAVMLLSVDYQTAMAAMRIAQALVDEEVTLAVVSKS